jgi:hypothetical protein
MQFGRSDAAVTAIRALQLRLRELQQEKQTLEDDVRSLKIQIGLNPVAPSAREAELMGATERARQMVVHASATMAQIQEARRQHEILKREIAVAEEALDESVPSEDGSVVEGLRRAKQVQSSIRDYESLLCDLFAAPMRSAADFIAGFAARGQAFDTDLVSQPLRHLVTRVMELPAAYQRQSTPTKRAIVQGLICAVEGAFALTGQLRELRRRQAVGRTPRRIAVDIRRSALDLHALEQAVNRFSFH